MELGQLFASGCDWFFLFGFDDGLTDEARLIAGKGGIESFSKTLLRSAVGYHGGPRVSLHHTAIQPGEGEKRENTKETSKPHGRDDLTKGADFCKRGCL